MIIKLIPPFLLYKTLLSLINTIVEPIRIPANVKAAYKNDNSDYSTIPFRP